ncbi:peptidoglycan-binding protein [Streptomyces sp. NPDC058145]|uniref:peptidoglycan-binding protein n=1 Tax=Streptomyces sp. NPDC058145 TaxID=3346356 RepID=UPI0036E03EAA
MTESSGHTCPECGAPRGPDNTPSCDCTERASEALRETRTAEAAAAEEFDSLRIRPYVEVGGRDGGGDGLAEPAEKEALPYGAALPDGEASADAARASGPAAEGAASHGPGSTRDLQPLGDFGAEPFPAPTGPVGRTRRRRTALLCVAGAGVVVAAVGLASGLFSYQEPTRDRTAPEVRESVPDEAPTSPGSAFSSRPASPSAAGLPAPTPSSPGTAPSASGSASRPAPSGTASGSPGPTATALVLRRGDQGLEVIDLQTRLSALNLYPDHIDGVYTRPVEDAVRTYQLARGVQGDTLGVYGAATRAKLESETW